MSTHNLRLTYLEDYFNPLWERHAPAWPAEQRMDEQSESTL